MRSKKHSTGWAAILALFAATMLMTSTRAGAQTETVLHSFNNGGAFGFHPVAGLIFDAAGNLYGTTGYGDANNFSGGTVFELIPQAGGGWKEKILHNFGNGKDGANPWAGLIFDGAGNLYGATVNGGTLNRGTVFELSPTAGGGWTEKILHNFGNGMDGYNPNAGLIFDASGNLYGTTTYGGVYGGSASGNGGTVFELTPKTGGGWTEKILHSFANGRDGFSPLSGLIFDAAGNLYGTTNFGGNSSTTCNADVHVSCGTVFELSPRTGGFWVESILHSFGHNAGDGNFPYGGLIFDAAGNLYGTTAGGGNSTSCDFAIGCGTVFELTPGTGGVWTETVLHNFSGGVSDGASPDANLIFDASGNLYSTTGSDGAYGGGTVFKLTPTTGGVWTLTLLHSFGHGLDGLYPSADLIFDASGNLYGATTQGGSSNLGMVFQITP